jgi:hypothetical protein
MELATIEHKPSAGGSGASNVRIGDREVVIEGKWLKVARIFDECWIEGQPVEAPEAFLASLKRYGARSDLFTFTQALPETDRKFDYTVEWDNLAVAPTTDFSTWWEGLPQESRKNVRRAERRNLVVRAVEFNNDLVRGIKGIYDETPIRQGRRFWHYGKDLETVKRENFSYLERSQFIGAYYKDELVGFLKMVYVGPTARIMQILAKNCHFDKRPVNALLAKAVEICSKRTTASLIYGQYIYDKKADSPVTEFKRRNGFHQLLLPRYYIPLSLKGRVALATRLHRGLKALLPGRVLSALLVIRQSVYARTVLRSKGTNRNERRYGGATEMSGR